jgi:hypothetical protein
VNSGHERSATKHPLKTYRMLLRLYPKTFRIRYGEQMESVFEDGLAGSNGTAWFWLGTIWDVCSHALLEHLHLLAANRTLTGIVIAAISLSGLLNIMNGVIQPDFDWSSGLVFYLQAVSMLGVFVFLNHRRLWLEILGLLLIGNVYVQFGFGVSAGWLSLAGFLVVVASQLQAHQNGWRFDALSRGLLLWFSARVLELAFTRFQVMTGYRAETPILSLFWLLEGASLLMLARLTWQQSRLTRAG